MRERLPEKWTGNLIGKMHNENVSQKDLAKELGMTEAYCSMILRGIRTPASARTRFEEAFQTIVARRNSE